MERPRTAVVTGANRGIGLEVARQLARGGLHVVLTGRSGSSVDAAVRTLREAGLDVEGEVLDVASESSVAGCAARLRSRGRVVDVLVNNAGIYSDGALLAAPAESITQVLATNLLGALWTARAWMPGMNERGYGRVVNVTSGYGSFAEGLEGPAAYALSKAALDALTVRLSYEASGNVKVNAACPGWVRTRMGGAGAPRTVEEGADTIVWLATLPDGGPSGGLFRSRQRVPW